MRWKKAEAFMEKQSKNRFCKFNFQYLQEAIYYAMMNLR